MIKGVAQGRGGREAVAAGVYIDRAPGEERIEGCVKGRDGYSRPQKVGTSTVQ